MLRSLMLSLVIAASAMGQISSYTESTSPDVNDLLYLLGDPDGTPVNRKLKIGTIKDNINAKTYGATGDGSTDDTVALQTAITAAVAAGWKKVHLPPGTYKLTDPLILDDGVYLEGVPGVSILQPSEANEAALDATSLSENISGVTIDGIVFDPNASGCYGIKGPTAPTYYLTAKIKNCDFYADLAYGIYGMLAFCEIDHCNFGRAGTAGPISQSITSLGASGKSTFTNRISFCWFEDTTDCHAAVEFRIGNTLLFDTCVWQVCNTPAVKVVSIQQVTFDNCNFEHMDPNSADANDVVVDLNVDAALTSARYVYAEFRGCKFNQTSGSAAAMTYIASGATAEFSRCKFNGDGSPYYSMVAGPTYDTLITRIWMCNTTGFASTISQTSYWNSTMDLQQGVYLKNGATSAGYARFYEDSDNDVNYATVKAASALTTDDEALTLDDDTVTYTGYFRSATAVYRRYYHVPLYSANPGASGATFVVPDANRVGGWDLDAASEYLYGESDVHSDWSGDANAVLEIRFCNNIAGTDVGDTIDIRVVFTYKGLSEDTVKTQTVEEATTIGVCDAYKNFEVSLQLDYDLAGNVLEAGDIVAMRINIETDTSEVDDITMSDLSFYYPTTHSGIETGDE